MSFPISFVQISLNWQSLRRVYKKTTLKRVLKERRLIILFAYQPDSLTKNLMKPKKLNYLSSYKKREKKKLTF